MKDMNTISKCLLTVIATTVTIAGCIYAGKVEYEDEVLSGMSAEKYQYIHDSLVRGEKRNVSICGRPEND